MDDANGTSTGEALADLFAYGTHLGLVWSHVLVNTEIDGC